MNVSSCFRSMIVATNIYRLGWKAMPANVVSALQVDVSGGLAYLLLLTTSIRT